MPKRRATKKSNPETPAKDSHIQGYLPDGDGGDMAPVRNKELDKRAEKFLEAKEQRALYDEDMKTSRDGIREIMLDQNILGPYFVAHADETYRFSIDDEPKISCQKVKRDEE